MGVAAERIRGNCSEHVIGQLLFRWAWEECREFFGSQGGEEQLFFFFSFPLCLGDGERHNTSVVNGV